MLENVGCYVVVENTRVFTAEAQRTQRPAEKKSLLYCSESLALCPLRLCGEGFNQLNFYEPTTPLD